MKADIQQLPLQELVPHAQPMLLVDELIDIDDASVTVAVDTTKRSLFSMDDGRVPSYVGLEYMAQTIGVLVGAHRLSHGKQVKIGFLLGSRKYNCSLEAFPANEVLIVKAQEHLRDEELGVFDCQIWLADELVASAQIKAVQPEDISIALGG